MAGLRKSLDRKKNFYRKIDKKFYLNKNCPDYKDEAESIDIELPYEKEGEE